MILSALSFYVMQADEDERGTKALEALIAAEQGRCRDLMMNLEQVVKSRYSDCC